MKKYVCRALAIFCSIILISACDKTESSNPDENTDLLQQVNRWDPVSGLEVPILTATYTSEDKLSELIIEPYTYTIQFNANGKVQTLTGLHKLGSMVEYQIEYNANNQVVKSSLYTKASASATAQLSRHDQFEYNGEGKIVKISSFEPDGVTINMIKEYTWTNNNIQSSTVSTGLTAQARLANSYNTTAMGYDDKANPMLKLGGIAEIIYSKAFPRNNPTQMKLKASVWPDFITEAFPIYEYLGSTVAGIKFNLQDGNSLLHIPSSPTDYKGLKFYYKD